jgi:DNA polymerase-3 subunit gamma/tau
VALALYRKYRPRTFAEVIGQEHVTEPLSQALRSGRLNHAYLFSGPRGCGKTSSARILARSLNCEKGPTPEPCGVCDSCVALAPDGAGSIDVIEIDAASHGGVDDARELRERAFYAPVSSRFKVYVIDEAHMVSSAGFNALLKLVEEPPDYVKFVFATTEPEKVLGTIKSRTHHYPFRLIPPGVLRPYLEQLARSEGVAVEPAVFPLVVRAGGGSARDSLSVLDQLIAGAGAEGVTYHRAVALLGVTDAALLDEMCDALAATDGGAMFAAIDRVMEAGHDPRRFASDLLERFRDLIILQQVPDAAVKGLFDYPADQLERLAAQATRLGPATLTRAAGIVHDGLTEMRGTTAPRLLLELISARMLLPGADESTGALLQRMERLERRLGAASAPPLAPSTAATPVDSPSPRGQRPGAPGSIETVPAPARDPSPPAVARPSHLAPSAASPVARPSHAAPSAAASPVVPPAPPGPSAAAPATPVAAPPAAVPTPAVPAAAVDPAAPLAPPQVTVPPPGDVPQGPMDAAAIRRVWDEVLVTVRRRSQKTWALVREATVRDVEGGTLVLLFQHQVHATMFGAEAKTLTDAVSQVVGGAWHVRWELTAGGAPGGASGTPAVAQQRSASSQSAPTHPAPAHPSPAPAVREPDGDALPPAADARDDEAWPEAARPGSGTPAPQAGSTPAASGHPTAPATGRPGRQDEPPVAPTARSIDAHGAAHLTAPGQHVTGDPGTGPVSAANQHPVREVDAGPVGYAAGRPPEPGSDGGPPAAFAAEPVQSVPAPSRHGGSVEPVQSVPAPSHYRGSAEPTESSYEYDSDAESYAVDEHGWPIGSVTTTSPRGTGPGASPGASHDAGPGAPVGAGDVVAWNASARSGHDRPPPGGQATHPAPQPPAAATAAPPAAHRPAAPDSGLVASRPAAAAESGLVASRPAVAPESGLAAARAAARNAAGRAAAAGRGTARATAVAAAAAPAATATVPQPAATHGPAETPGFDPGDEPLDDDLPGNRESSEEQAIRLLRELLGAEPIG